MLQKITKTILILNLILINAVCADNHLVMLNEDSIEEVRREYRVLMSQPVFDTEQGNLFLEKMNDKIIPAAHIVEFKAMIQKVVAKMAPAITQEQVTSIATKMKGLVATYAQAISMGALLAAGSAVVSGGGDLSAVPAAMLVGIFQSAISTTLTLTGTHAFKTEAHDPRLQFSVYQATRALITSGTSLYETGAITLASSPILLGVSVVQDAITAQLYSEYSQKGLQSLLGTIRDKSMAFAREVSNSVNDFGKQLMLAE